MKRLFIEEILKFKEDNIYKTINQFNFLLRSKIISFFIDVILYIKK